MSDLPMTVPAEGLPSRVTIYEVGPRDGLQNESGLIQTEVKAELIQRLLLAGLPVVAASPATVPSNGAFSDSSIFIASSTTST